MIDLKNTRLYVTSTSIKNFSGRGLFNKEDSTTYAQVSSGGKVEETPNGVQVKGWLSKDGFGMKLPDYPGATKVDGYEFFLIKNMESAERLVPGSSSVNGIMGLAPRSTATSTNYVADLHTKGLIPSPVFSLLIADSTGQSSITLGDTNMFYV